MVPKTNLQDLLDRATGENTKPPNISPIGKFEEDLDAILSLYEDGYPEKVIVQGAIFATMALIRAIDTDHAYHRTMPFMRLTNAFTDIERGLTPPLFDAGKGKRGTPRSELQMRALAVRAYEILRQKAREFADFEQPDRWAAKTIVKELQLHDVKIKGQRESADWQILQNWQRNMSSGALGDDGLTVYKATEEGAAALSTKKHTSLQDATAEVLSSLIVTLILFGHIRTLARTEP